MRRIPWEEIRREYVEGTERDGARVYPSQRDLASKYDVEISTIGRRAKREGWAVAREVFASRVLAERQRKSVDMLSDEGSALDLSAFQIAQAGLARISAAVGDKEQRPMDADEINKLSSAAQRFHQMGRLALGEDAGKDSGRLVVEFVTGEDG